MQILILLIQLLLVAMSYVNLKNQEKIIGSLKKPKRKPQRRQRPRRHVIVKKTHEREIVRVTPTSSEFMQQQYKRVAEQYANK